MFKRKSDILVIGGLPDYEHHIEIGGATILMNNLVTYMRENNVPHKMLQTNKFNNLRTKKNNRFKSICYFFLVYFCNIWFYERILYNFSDHGIKRIYPFLLRLSKCLGQKVALHKFGGTPEKLFNELNYQETKKVEKAFVSTDLVLLETQGGIAYLLDRLPNIKGVKWYPNVRTPYDNLPNKYAKSNAIIFLGHVLDEKGISELLELGHMLDGYQIDIYGRIKQEKYRNYDFAKDGVNYLGEISGDKVQETISRYKYLLLPSYSEGYPGVIIEALSVGVPIIATNVGGVPEMITDGAEGRLVEPRSAQALYDAIMSISESTYYRMSRVALNSFNNKFNSNTINRQVINFVMNM